MQFSHCNTPPILLLWKKVHFSYYIERFHYVSSLIYMHLHHNLCLLNKNFFTEGTNYLEVHYFQSYLSPALVPVFNNFGRYTARSLLSPSVQMSVFSLPLWKVTLSIKSLLGWRWTKKWMKAIFLNTLLFFHDNAFFFC